MRSLKNGTALLQSAQRVLLLLVCVLISTRTVLSAPVAVGHNDEAEDACKQGGLLPKPWEDTSTSQQTVWESLAKFREEYPQLCHHRSQNEPLRLPKGFTPAPWPPRCRNGQGQGSHAAPVPPLSPTALDGAKSTATTIPKRQKVVRFMHIPKTGGTSMNRLLERIAGYYNLSFCEVAVDRGVNLDVDPSLSNGHSCDIITAEADGSQLTMFRFGQDVDVFDVVMLRNPLDRFLSQYQHHLAARRFEFDHFQTHRERMQAFANPESCSHLPSAYCMSLSDPGKCIAVGGWCGIFQNHQARILGAGRQLSQQDRDAILEEPNTLQCRAFQSLSRFHLVGVTEDLDGAVCLLLHKMDWTRLFSECCRPTMHAQGYATFELSCRLLRRHSRENVRKMNDHAGSDEPPTAASAGNDDASNSGGSSHYADEYHDDPELLRSLQVGLEVDEALYNVSRQMHRMEVGALVEKIAG